jgi:uncharacterized protein YndB with AHSA1/START domain
VECAKEGIVMNKSANLKVMAQGDREIVMTRTFNAPRKLVFEAFTQPALLKRWLFGPDDWSLPVCEVDLKVGGKYRYVWRCGKSGQEMGAGGVYREIVAPERIVATEKFDEAWYEGEAVITFVFTEQQGKTLLTQTLTYKSREARDMVLKSGMETGLGRSYDRLEEMFSSAGRSAGS